MKIPLRHIIFLLLASLSVTVSGQGDEDPPESPVFTFVTINPTTGKTEMTWTLSPDIDVAGYVIYLYIGAEAYAIDTIYDSQATTYSVTRPYTNYYSESYVIAAIDSSLNISPLSNELHTIFIEPEIDSCRNTINITWNRYSSSPVKVTGYDVLISVNGGTYYLAGHVSDETTSFVVENFVNGTQYCIIIRATLENSLTPASNKSCVDVKTQIIPGWINADFATVTAAGEISLSFTIDPSSETDLYSLERGSGNTGTFQQIAQIRSDNKTLEYIDKSADPEIMNFYRLSAINSCDIQVVSSNIASNIALTVQISGNDIVLRWNKYHDWLGSVSSYRLFTDTGNGFIETAILSAADTTFSVSVPEIMYSLKNGQACFYVKAEESGNPHGMNGESNSNQVCTEIGEVITVPNVFTPDGDLKNDLFRPVITFTPSEYRFLISNRQGKSLFDTDDFLDTWDGTDNGKPVPEGVYLWFLKLKTPEGKSISQTGTVTVIKN
jgi:gliding motility-associated-like protein